MILKDLKFLKMSLKKVFLFFFFSFILAFTIFFFLSKIENLIEKKVIREIKQQAQTYNIQVNSINIEKISFNHCVLSKIEIGEQDSLNIPYISLDYNILDLINKHLVKKVEIEGLNLRFLISKNNKIAIKGIPPLESFQNSKDNIPSNFILPDIVIKKSFLEIEINNKNNIIPFNLSFLNNSNQITLLTKLNPNFCSIEYKGNLSRDFSGKLSGKIKLNDLNYFLQLFNIENNIILNGFLEFNNEIHLDKGEFSRIDFNEMKGEFKTSILDQNIHFENLIKGNFDLNSKFEIEKLDIKGDLSSIHFSDNVFVKSLNYSFNKNEGNSYSFKILEGKLEKPYSIDFFITGFAKNIFNNLEIESKLNVKINKNIFNFGEQKITLSTPIDLQGKTNFNIKSKLFNGNFKLNQNINISVDNNLVGFEDLKQTIFIKGNLDTFILEINNFCRNLNLKSNNFGNFESKSTSFNIKSTLENFKIKDYNGELKINDFNYYNNEGISLLNGNLSFPINSSTNKNKGTLFLNKITTPDIYFENLKCNLNTENIGKALFNFEGTTTLPIDKLTLNFQGIFTPKLDSLAKINFDIQETTLETDTFFSPLSVDLEGIIGGGIISLKGNADVDSLLNIKSTCNLKLTNFLISDVNNTWKVENLSTNITFSDFIGFRSLPNQKLKFSYAGTNTLGFQNGIVNFNIVNDETVMIEKTKFKFCDGNIFTSAFQLSTNLEKIEVDVYCQKLSLPILLNSFIGEKKALGEGYLSGIVPVIYENGNISFEKSFLHTVPGEKGVLKIEDGKDITGGVILAEEAIKNFEYDWAKIDFETVDNNLNLILKLDGKPAGKLPLVYDDKTGNFIKDPKNEKHVELQGLKLDLKFVDIDINHLLKQQQKLKFSSNK